MKSQIIQRKASFDLIHFFINTYYFNDIPQPRLFLPAQVRTADKSKQMEPVTTSAAIAAVVGYLAKTLNEDKSIKKFFGDFSEATVNWIRPLFLKEDDQPKDAVKDLQDDPAEAINQEAVKIELQKALKKQPELEQHLRSMYDQIQQKAQKGEQVSIQIKQGKNINTGNISAGGNVRLGDDIKW